MDRSGIPSQSFTGRNVLLHSYVPVSYVQHTFIEHYYILGSMTGTRNPETQNTVIGLKEFIF